MLLKYDIVCRSYDNVYMGLLFSRTHVDATIDEHDVLSAADAQSHKRELKINKKLEIKNKNKSCERRNRR